MRYTKSHEWVSVDGFVGTVGITEYVQKELGEIVYLDLPKIGQEVIGGSEACVLESTKAAVDVYSPVSGKVIAVNEALKSSLGSKQEMDPSPLWLFRVEMSCLDEYERLMTGSEYRDLCL